MSDERKIYLTDEDIEKIGNIFEKKFDDKFKQYVGIAPNNRTLLEHVDDRISSLNILDSCAEANTVIDFVIETKCKEDPKEYRMKAIQHFRNKRRRA